jgi:DNA-binding GntR family transcriptional regulator
VNAPRYVQLAGTLEAGIAAGLYPVGSLLPTEVELCDRYGVSRHTVREALRRLAEAGLVRRRQGSGSQVIAARPQRAYVHAMRSLGELFQYAADTRLRIDRILHALPGPELFPEAADGPPWLGLEGLREQAGGAPIAWTAIWIAPAYVGIEPELAGHEGAIHPLIEARFGVEIAVVEQEITARPMPEPAATVLGLPAAARRHAWSVRVVRRYRDAAGAPVLASVNFHPAEDFTYTMQLRREGRPGP